MVCIAVLLTSYVVGLGIQKVRFAAAETKAPVAAETEEPADKPESDADEVVADTETGSEPPEERSGESYAEQAEEFAAQPKRPRGGNARMVVVGSQGPGGMGERFQSMAAEKSARRELEERARQELQARRAKIDEENLRRLQEAWPNLDEETRGKIRGIMERWPTMSEQERDYHRAGNID